MRTKVQKRKGGQEGDGKETAVLRKILNSENVMYVSLPTLCYKINL